MSDRGIQTHRHHVFCINHDPLFLELMRELLQMEQYAVTTTNFVPTTFHQILGAQPDLVIVDLKVNEQSCWLLLEQLQRDVGTNPIPVIVLSTDARLLSRAQAESGQYAGDRFFVKPIDFDELLAAIAELLGKPEMAAR